MTGTWVMHVNMKFREAETGSSDADDADMGERIAVTEISRTAGITVERSRMRRIF